MGKELSVAVILTVKNDAAGCAVTLESLALQTRTPDEIVVVDGGSKDNTLDVIRAFSARLPQLRWIESPGANIAEGRNIGTQAATGAIIATTDAGCRAAPDWLEKLVAPFETDPQTEFVAGFYRIEPHSLLEQVVGLATMRGQLDPIDPATFNPSGRSMAYTKPLWRRAGGWPAWL
ncbi:MAG: glycosyltransferase [Phycisphaerales bacterium]|nr:glycosyltransferase [Phycisphaerales bacterium]